MANPKGNPANLAPPWPKGTSGNPRGGPRKRPLSAAYDDLLQSPLPQDVRRVMKLPEGATWADGIARSRGLDALRRGGSSVQSAKEMREAVEGKATQRFELASENTIEVVVSYEQSTPQRIVEPMRDERAVIDVEATPELPAERELDADADVDADSDEQT